MNTFEDDIRTVLDRQANAMQVPEPHLDRGLTLIKATAPPHPRRGWMLATAAVLIGIVIAAVVLIERPSDKPAMITDKPTLITTTPPDTTTPLGPTNTTTPSIVTPTPQTTTAEATDTERSDLDPSLAAVLTAPSPDETAQASNTALYLAGTGHSEVSAQQRFVALRRCWRYFENPPCTGTEGWAYVAGSADSVEVHYGLLPTTNYLVVSPIDDRLFVASGDAGSAQDPEADPPVWLIDSITGQRGALTWHDEPATLDSPDQELVLYPAHAQNTYVELLNDLRLEGFLPRVVDRRDWSIRPLRVPSDASPAMPVHQPESGRIWVGTAPDGGVAGLAYTDDGGASWTRVDLPAALRPSSGTLTSSGPGEDRLLVVAASGDRVAVTKWWGRRFGRPNEELFVTTNAGATWTTAQLDPTRNENGMEVFALADGRLVVATTLDWRTERLFVSGSASDWPRLEELPHEVDSHIDVSQGGIAVNYRSIPEPQVTFSTDLNTWWTIPNYSALADT